jgi:hypothetical protein
MEGQSKGALDWVDSDLVPDVQAWMTSSWAVLPVVLATRNESVASLEQLVDAFQKVGGV